ncbi:MAG: c-type cytochrome, partial [Myxococcales bacterium]|nr:c-type cytochrome [Myxococcales bacterium]
ELAELDALAVTPAELRIKRYRLGAGYDSGVTIASSGGAPSGIALSADETTAFVFCRATFEVAIVPLVALERHVEPAAVKMVKLAEEDPLLAGMAKTDPKRAFREAAAFGRRLYFGALATEIGEHLGCAGCHPDGRDDGNVWLEIDHESTEPVQVGSLGAVKNRLHQLKDSDFRARQKLVVGVPRARQTPMVAGRVFADGPSGWRGESDGLVARIGRGFALHRWEPYTAGTGLEGHARALAAFVLRGLPPPERSKAPLSPIAERGRALFESDAVGCKSCHPLVEDKNLGTTSLHFPPTRAGHASEMAEPFRIPSLRFVGGTPPYFHDGSATTLAALVAMTKNHMGRTAQLEDDDRAALVAFLETL